MLKLQVSKFKLELNPPRWLIVLFIGVGIYAASVPNRFSDGDTLTASSLNANFEALATAAAPVGSIMAFGGSTPPTGWLLCNGAQVSRSTYGDLYGVIGTSFGAGDGSTTFHLPDLRGRFMRGVDGTAGIDPDKASRTALNAGGATGNAVGSVQGDAFKSHTHTTNKSNYGGSGADYQYADYSGGVQVAGTTQATGGNETRPVNVYVNHVIKQ